ncbi:neuraminidase-like domain-containing protein [Amycolatopsis sp. WQ 127309]|uniref:neuraminidase-like domain-containing protein n=1 Tax=Amycolatopsis sp. WQ 127309 TaxID=2932773 RepID=UPI001FF1C1B8|nr:neuraminidase-like domain-containing protein [Amycolatopsis sp. WQ 127309]UOZ03508.1 neuraminidase-like domain-containing protein [Amycolatopsis sp. WQ 127309]
MRAITAPLEPGDTADAVVSLQTALLVLLRRNAIAAEPGTQKELLAVIPKEQADRTYRDATAKAVSLFQEQRRFEATGVVDDRTAAALNSLLRGLGLLDDDDGEPAPDPHRYLVRGRLSSASRPGVGGIRIVVADRGVGGDTALTQTRTAADGTYEVTFNYETAKADPDLQAHAYADREALLGSSPVRYNAGHTETLDIAVADDAQTALAAEHQTLTADLGQHYDGSLADLQETADRPDVTYLANKTGWDARAVAVAALAEQFGARTAGTGDPAIAPGLFYALFRAGLPPTDTAIYAADPATVDLVWRQAIDQGVIAADLAGQLPAALKTFTTLAAQRALSGPAVAGRSSLGELLDLSLPAEQHEPFARLQLEHRGSTAAFWRAAERQFGLGATLRLQVDGRLAYLTLNNAPLVAKLHQPGRVTDPAQLLDRGFHHAQAWLPLIDTAPAEIPGDDEAARRANYAQVLATQLRLSYPTAALAAMVGAGETPVRAAAGVRDFLTAQAHRFDVGVHPIDQFLHRNADVTVDPVVRADIARVQRVRQITPSDEAMNALLTRGIDSAYAVAGHDRAEFVAGYAGVVGGAETAALIHARAQQVHLAVLNIATSYVLAGKAPAIGVHTTAQIVDPSPVVPAEAGDVIAYPTLQELLGDQDYCDCDECRSVLSPAAYLVDLLQFLDRDDARWAQFTAAWPGAHGDAPYPYADLAAWTAAGSPAGVPPTPLGVLLSRRPDLQYLPLTCENTNTALPYIDLVNETLEYYVTHGLTLDGFTGHSTDDRVSTEELLANPQFVQDSAYDVLAGKTTPAPLLPPSPLLPLHEPLNRLRRLFAAFGTPLPRVMEVLRAGDAVERPDEAGYGWRDVWLEQLRLSRPEADRLTDSTLTLQTLYGYPSSTPDSAVLADLSGAKDFCHRVGLGYDDLIAVLRTQAMNPAGTLIPRLDRLGVPLATLAALHDGTLPDADFDAALAPQLDPAQYGGDIKAWVRTPAVYARIMDLVVLTDPAGGTGFAALALRYADPARLADPVRPSVFIRLLRFLRLWRALGWTIAQTDAAIAALYPAADVPAGTDDEATALAKLDHGWRTLLPRLGVVSRVAERLNLSLARDLPSLLACFGPIGTYGETSLYRTLFAPAKDPVFADDGYGGVLTGSARLLDHAESVRAALSLTGDEFAAVTAALGFDATTPLTVEVVSEVFRRGWLARKLKLGVTELLRLLAHTGLDVFDARPDRPDLPALLDLLDGLRAAGLKPAAALYLVWNDDLGGASAPPGTEVNEFARGLRAALAAVDGEFGVVDDPDGQITRARMALVYDAATTDVFFGLLGSTLGTDVAYAHPEPVLPDAVLAAAPGRIGYDDFGKRLSFAGVLSTAVRDALKAAGATPAFQAAVDALYTANRLVVDPFFDRYPELRPLHDTYVTSAEPEAARRTALLAAFLPDLLRHRKRQLAVAAIGGAAHTDPVFAATVLDDPAVLHAAADATAPALDDLVAVQRPGLSARFHTGPDLTGPELGASDAEAVVGVLPPGAAGPVSAVWSGFLEAPATDTYNLRIETGAAAAVTLTLDGTAIALSGVDGRWANTEPVRLTAGTLRAVELTVLGTTTPVRVSWQSPGRGWETVPGRAFYPATPREHLAATYTRFFKAASLAAALRLTPAELAHLTGGPHRIGGGSWLNALAVTGVPDGPTATALTSVLTGLLGHAALKAAYAPDDERLLAALTALPDTAPLCALTGWPAGTATALLARIGASPADLADPAVLARLTAAAGQVQLFGVPAPALIAATGNDPDGAAVRAFTGALRSRYAPADWLAVIKPVNDELRARQRDALVAYVLHQMRANPASAHIDTADKLFEYFLMDVQMDPCTQTSRIRNALSTVQLFTDRCLMNLEPRVAASALEAAQWEWMRRYRVWEANRKVFLWPENWLEPELRDDQSPFFREMMSELLQSDITDDAAEIAFGKYLGKLADVALLEPCGMHVVTGGAGTADDVTHVVARSAGTARKYYSRRREAGSWTPWEEIGLDIEDTPVIPVVWRSRLLLFWLRMVPQPDLSTATPIKDLPDRNLTALRTGDLNAAPPKLTYQAMLCWSEYANGAWKPVQTSSATAPTTLGTFSADSFLRSRLRLSAHEEGTALRIGITGQGGSSFLLYNTHSLPVRAEDQPPPSKWAVEVVPATRSLSTAGGTLSAEYSRGLSLGAALGLPGAGPLKRPVLRTGITASTVEPAHDLANRWDAPFFFHDSRSSFYVTTAEEQVSVPEWGGYVVTPQPAGVVPQLPPMVYQKPVFEIPDRVGPVAVGPDAGVIDPVQMQHYVTEDAYITRGIATLGTVPFGDGRIGPAGIVVTTPRS